MVPRGQIITYRVLDNPATANNGSYHFALVARLTPHQIPASLFQFDILLRSRLRLRWEDRHGSFKELVRDFSCFYLYHLAIVTAFAVDDFGTFWRITRFKFVGAMLGAMRMCRRIPISDIRSPISAAHALPIVKSPWILHAKPLVVPAIRAETRKGEIPSSVELEFPRHDPKGARALLEAFASMCTPNGFL